MTLEKGKSYGLEQIQQTLQDKSRTRLNNPVPHQAPQRERVSRAQIPSSRSGTGSGRSRARRWKTLIRPDVNLGVPTLMMILEPNIVWEHTKAFVQAVGKDVEANVTPGDFLEGWHKGGRRAHGIYEGSYWELMGDYDELSEMLRKMSKAPALLEEPPLELPPPPELPAWDDFKPNLHVIPAVPSLPPLKLPPFRAPILEPEPPFVEPEYVPLPTVPPAPKEEPLPIFIPPEFLQVEPLYEPPYVEPSPPLLSEPPRAPEFGEPKHGYDWTGTRPFQLDLPDRDAFLASAASQRIMDTSRFVHPPSPLPQFPELEALDIDLLKGLDLEPIPKLELAWMGGPEPDPPYASVPASPAALSRHSSRTTSRPTSALTSASRPRSATASATTTPSKYPSGDGGDVLSTSSTPGQPSQTLQSTQPSQSIEQPEALPTPPAPPRARSSRRMPSSSRIGPLVMVPSIKTQEDSAWEEARSIASEASGTPRVWVNFAAPFADLPPIMMPARPEPGPEPVPEDFPHEPLEELPGFVAPELLALPAYVEPRVLIPQWAAPTEPRPVGFLRGSAPVIICDVSGTMNPRQQGQFRQMKRCAVDLLDPEGEIATAAMGFDVITFAGTAWSWSLGYGERLNRLQSSQQHYSGRQVGGKYSSKTPPGAGSRNASPDRLRGNVSASGGLAASSVGGLPASLAVPGSNLSLMPSQPDLLSDAQRWVANWPDAVGQTHLLSAFNLADQHAAADCWYVLSDGMAHDQTACMDWLRRRLEAGEGLPVIHAVGFIPEGAHPDCSGERFLRGLAEMTGGSYQRYSPDVTKVWIPGKGFTRVDLRDEPPERREERLWAERQLRAERLKNLRLGILEPLETTLKRLIIMHQAMRVAPAMRAHEAALTEAARRHTMAMESVRTTNERRLVEAQMAYDAAVEGVRSRNQARVDAAREAFLQAHADWERDYLDKLQDWEDAKAVLEQQREEQLAAMRPGSRPGSAVNTPPRSYLSRPTSATRLNAYAAGRPDSRRSSRLEASEHRASYAALEYDSVIGLERLSDKLVSPVSTPPSSRPVSGVPQNVRGLPRDSSSYASTGGTPGAGGSGSAPGSRPLSGYLAAATAAAGLGVHADVVASEYLDAIAEDVTETLTPLDAVEVGMTPGRRTVPSLGEPGGEIMDDDGNDIRPSSSRVDGRDQDSSSNGSRRRTVSATTRPYSATSVPTTPGSARRAGRASNPSRMSASTGGMLPPPPPLPEPSAPLEPMRGEKSDEFKRRFFPPEVVEELDAANAQRLDEIRQEWEDIVAADLAQTSGRKLAAMRRNAARVDSYRTQLYEAYASALIKDVVYGGAVRVAANLAIMDLGEARYREELARVEAENARLRALHELEVAQRRQQEEMHEEAVDMWQNHRDVLCREHEASCQRAKAEHETNLTRMRAEWRAKKQQVLELNDARLSEAEAAYNEVVARVQERNRVAKAEHAELVKARKDAEATNHSRLAEAKTVHKVRIEVRTADNERLIKGAMEEHQALCARLTEEYEDAKVQAEADHGELCTFLRAANEQLTEEARRRYQEALTEVQAAYEADCISTRELHSRDLERVRRYNQDIWPKVAVARLAQAELARVQLFAEHIRYCANKFEMGINLLPNTPNYDRVVEMQALTEALGKAFPDVPSSELPWPDHERRLEPGTGWVVPPVPRTCTYRDPAIEIINRIARGKSAGSIPMQSGSPNSQLESPRNSPAIVRPRSGSCIVPAFGPMRDVVVDVDGGIDTSSGSVDDPPPPQPPPPHQQNVPTSGRHISRPLSAGRARFAGVLSAESAAGQRPLSATAAAPPGGAATNRVEAWGSAVSAAAAAITALSSPGGMGSPYLRPQSAVGYQNPSAWRRSNTSLLRGASQPWSQQQQVSNMGAAAAAAASAMTPGSRPMTARPGTANTPILPPGPSRPRSAGPAPRPARVAVDVTPLQASVARSKAQAGAHILTGATLAGFSKDVPKLRYPEVDVQQPLTVGR